MFPSLRRLAFFMFILLIIGQVWALGGKEDPLVYADKLIKEQKYDEAILYLTEFMKLYPFRFDQAQQRLKKIIEIRMAYNKKADALLDVLEKEPTNNEKKIAMIKELETFEKNPNVALKDFVSQTKVAAVFTYNKSRFEQIMAKGLLLIEAGNYMEAVKLYETGFDLYRQEFMDAGYDEITVNLVFSRIKEIGDSAFIFDTSGKALEQAFLALADAYKSDNFQKIAEAQDTATQLARSYTALRSKIVTTGRSLEDQFALLTKIDPKLTDSSFLPFAFRLVLGRKTETKLEGITGALDAQWRFALGSAHKAMETQASAKLEQGKALFGEGRWEESSARFKEGAELARSGIKLVALWSHYIPDELLNRSTLLGQSILSSKGGDYLRLLHFTDSNLAWAELASLEANLKSQNERLAAIPNDSDPTASASLTFENLALMRKGFTAIRSGILELRAASGERAKQLAALTTSGYAGPVSGELQGLLDGTIATSLGSSQEGIVKMVTRIAAFEFGKLDEKLANQLALIKQADSLLKGVPSNNPQMPDTIFRYPTKAISTIANTDAELKALNAEIAATIARYKTEDSFIASAASVGLWLAKTSGLTASIKTGIGETADITAKAKEQKRLAESSKLEAERRLAEAGAALKAANFEAARERLDRARERYSASLSYEQDPALRTLSDQTLNALAGNIIKAENDKVVLDTRKLLTAGKSSYLEGQFNQAQETLLQARSRWKTTNATPETEVEYWLKLVQTALMVKSGRDIPITAPLYPEMSQLLSLAKQYYSEGANLLSKGDKTGALKTFAQARQKIDEVKVIFPLNQEAGVLNLKIDKLIDPGVFNRAAAAKIAAARVKIRNKVELASVYSDLQDLAAIDANFTGLKALIVEAEILLGLRLPPPDPKALAESRSLTKAAQKIYDSLDRARFDFAKSQLTRALELDPNNQEAANLKDKIATSVGGDQTIILPANIEILYNEAVSLFTNSDYISARSRIIQIYSMFPKAKTMQKVVDLDLRLQATGN